MGPDARFHWLRDSFPSDQFLLYCFALPRDWPTAQAERLLARARRIADLNVRVREVRGGLDFPLLVPRAAAEDDITIHPYQGLDWAECLEVVGELMGSQLRADEAAWRLHLLGPVYDSPAGPDPVAVVVLQISHVLGDGRRTSAIARDLLGSCPLPELELRTSFGAPSLSVMAGAARFPVQFAQTMRWGIASAAESRRSSPSTTPDAGGVPVTLLNRPSGQRRLLRTIVLDRRAMKAPDTTVTATALSAISCALADYLDLDPGHPLAAELTIGVTPQPGVRNNFRNRGIGLPLDVDPLDRRSRMIGETIEKVRASADRRPDSAAWRAEQATPPTLMRLGARGFDTGAIPDRMTGVTVVSSVHRGPADLSLGSVASASPTGAETASVLFTAGFPALSPMQGLTHGVHGIGDAVVVSVTTSPDVMPDVDRYVDMLRGALARVRPGS